MAKRAAYSGGEILKSIGTLYDKRDGDLQWSCEDAGYVHWMTRIVLIVAL